MVKLQFDEQLYHFTETELGALLKNTQFFSKETRNQLYRMDNQHTVTHKAMRAILKANEYQTVKLTMLGTLWVGTLMDESKTLRKNVWGLPHQVVDRGDLCGNPLPVKNDPQEPSEEEPSEEEPSEEEPSEEEPSEEEPSEEEPSKEDELEESCVFPDDVVSWKFQRGGNSLCYLRTTLLLSLNHPHFFKLNGVRQKGLIYRAPSDFWVTERVVKLLETPQKVFHLMEIEGECKETKHSRTVIVFDVVANK
jgi:hypothetical protein